MHFGLATLRWPRAKSVACGYFEEQWKFWVISWQIIGEGGSLVIF